MLMACRLSVRYRRTIVLRCTVLKLNSHYFAIAYNLGHKFLCPYVAYHSKAIFSMRFHSSSAHEYVVRYLTAQRELTDLYLEVGSWI